jgi:hypothetical protein
MAKVLLANIGNRTLVAKKNNGSLELFEKHEFQSISKSHFRENTRWIEEQIRAGNREILEEMDVNIINAIFEKEGIPDYIYLFTSDQEGEDEVRKRQDTIHAGYIIAELLGKEYGDRVKVEPITITGSVVKLDHLTVRFREEMKRLVFEKHPDDKIIICDSGGTPQQKNALKIVSEYFLSDREPSFYQVREEIDPKTGEAVLGKGEAVRLENNEIGQIVDEQNISLLIDSGEYSAAATLRRRTLSDIPEILLRVMSFRKELLHNDAIGQLSQDPNSRVTAKDWLSDKDLLQEVCPSICNFLLKKTPEKWEDWRSDFRSSAEFHKLCEELELASFYWHLGKWTEAIRTYAIFVEDFLNSIYSKRNIKRKGTNSHYLDNINDIKIKNELKPDGSILKVLPTSVSTYIAYLLVMTSCSDILKSILYSFKQCNSMWTETPSDRDKGLDRLRNNISHSGTGVTKADIDKYIPDFEKIIRSWHDQMGVPFEKDGNAFFKANEEIKKLMKLL